MSFEKNLRRLSRALPSTPPPPGLRDRIKRNLPQPIQPIRTSLTPRFAVARAASVRKSAASQADRPANSLPPFTLSPRCARALRVSGWILLSTTTLTGLVGGVWWHHVNQAPTIRIPEPHVISPNGYPALIAATNRMRDEEAVNNAISKTATTSHVPPTSAFGASQKGTKKKSYTLAEQSALIAENAPALQALRAALKVPAQVPPRRDWNTVSPELVRFRQMSRLLLLEGQVWEEKGKPGRAANAYLNVMELGERMAHGGTLIHKLTALTCESTGRRYLISLSDELSPTDTQTVLQRLQDIQNRRSAMGDCLSEEKRLTQTELDRRFQTQNYWQIARSFAMDYAMPGEEGEPAKLTLNQQFYLTARLARYSKSEVAAANRRYMDALIAQSKLPFDRARPAPAQPPDYLNQLLTPVDTASAHKEADARAQNALLIGKLAIEAFRKETGSLPNDWDTLVKAGYLSAAPVDPFAKNGTDKLRYVPSAHLKGTGEFLLYSIGPDGIDDGGSPIPPSKTIKDKRWTQIDDNGDFVLGANFY